MAQSRQFTTAEQQDAMAWTPWPNWRPCIRRMRGNWRGWRTCSRGVRRLKSGGEARNPANLTRRLRSASVLCQVRFNALVYPATARGTPATYSEERHCHDKTCPALCRSRRRCCCSAPAATCWRRLTTPCSQSAAMAADAVLALLTPAAATDRHVRANLRDMAAAGHAPITLPVDPQTFPHRGGSGRSAPAVGTADRDGRQRRVHRPRRQPQRLGRGAIAVNLGAGGLDAQATAQLIAQLRTPGTGHRWQRQNCVRRCMRCTEKSPHFRPM